jgi:hypothetical protein
VTEGLLCRFDYDTVRPHTDYTTEVSDSECALDLDCSACECVTLSLWPHVDGVASLPRS